MRAQTQRQLRAKWGKVLECVEKDEEDELIGPSGNAGSSVSLHVEGGKVDELQKFLQSKIDAEVLKTEQAVEEGLFGEGLEAEKFRDRAGDLTIISHGRKIHWFSPETLEDKGFMEDFTGRIWMFRCFTVSFRSSEVGNVF